MNIKINIEYSDIYEESQELFIDGKSRENVSPLYECPEDAYIGRALVAPTDILQYMQEAYDAGKKGEPFEVEIIDPKEEEE